MAINADDYEPGLHITVTGALWNRGDRSYKGEPMKILHVELPFIVVEMLNYPPKGILPRVCSIDTREWTIMRLSPTYVRLVDRGYGGPALEGVPV